MRPIYDLASFFAVQISTAEDEAGRVYEPMVGIVTDNRDPQKLGRVRINFPVLSERDASYWAPIVMLGAGRNRGWFFIPEIDDEVLVMFEHGDINRPAVVGALWNGKDKPPDKNRGGNPRRTIKSRAGSKITFDDDTDKLVFEDGTGKGRITLDANANKIVIEALDGDVCLQAPQGEMQIVCKSAELAARQNIEIHTDMMRWSASASARINGSRRVTLSGSHVNLNCGIAQSVPAPTAVPQEVPDPYEARGPAADGQGAPATPSPDNAVLASSTGRGSSGSAHNEVSDLPPLEPQPMLVSATWARVRAAASTNLKLSALCADLAGKPATFTIRDADNESATIATLDATCGDNNVESTWTTPSSGPPGRFVFEVAADGKQARSAVLTLVNTVEVKLVLDHEPARAARLRLRAEPSGEDLTAEADENGVARFDDAPFGDYTLFLDGGAPS